MLEVAQLPHRAFLVDEEVIGDVRPAFVLVKALDVPQPVWCIGAGPTRCGGVMHTE